MPEAATTHPVGRAIEILEWEAKREYQLFMNADASGTGPDYQGRLDEILNGLDVLRKHAGIKVPPDLPRPVPTGNQAIDAALNGRTQ